MKHTRKTLTRIATIMMAFAVTFTALPVVTGSFAAHAVSTPAQVKTFNATTYSNTSIRLTWKKPGKVSGYAIYVNGKYLRVVPATWTAYNVPKLRAATTYKFTIRSYNTYKQKQYYNSRTKKWQASKPASRYWVGRKTRTVTKYKYGKVSPTRSAITGPAQITGLKASAKTHNSVTLSWKKQTAAVTGYVLYRDGKYVTTIGKNATSYKNAGLAANKTYSYRMRSYYKVGSKNIYGAYSATIKVTTNKAPSQTTTVSTPPANGVTVQDTSFQASSLPNKTLYIDKTNSYSDCLYTLATSKSIDDAITWTSSNPSVAVIEKDLYTGAEALVVVKSKGTTTITATNWDGQKKTATVTVKSVNDGNTPSEPEPEVPDNGVVVYNGKVYPADDGIFDLAVGDYYDFKIGSVDVSMKEIPTAFPDGATFRVNATNMIKETDYHLDGVLQPGVHSQKGYNIGSVGVTSISDKSKIIYTPLYSMDVSAGGIFFIDSGTCQVVFGNGKTYTFIISGQNSAMLRYRNYVQIFVNKNKYKSEEGIALAAVQEALSFKYGFTNDPFAMVTSDSSVGGNCFAKAQLAHRLMSELGVECYEHLAYRNNNARHMVLEIIINGNTYIADPTNREDLTTWEEYESATGRTIERNRDTYATHPSIVN